MQYTTAREEIRTIRVCFIKQIVLLPYKSDNKTAVQSERLFYYFNILEYPLPSCTQRDTRLKVAEEISVSDMIWLYVFPSNNNLAAWTRSAIFSTSLNVQRSSKKAAQSASFSNRRIAWYSWRTFSFLSISLPSLKSLPGHPGGRTSVFRW